MEELKKFIYEDATIYELGENDVYYFVTKPEYYDIKGCYAKSRFEFLLENNLEFLAYLADNNRFEDYFISYQKEMMQQERLIFQKSQKQDAMSKLMAREILLYQDLT